MSTIGTFPPPGFPPAIRSYVQRQLDQGVLWPDPLLQLNPLFAQGDSIDELVAQDILHQECARIFRKKSQDDHAGRSLRLHKHQEEAIRVARGGHSYILTTGTGSYSWNLRKKLLCIKLGIIAKPSLQYAGKRGRCRP